ncbi:MAG: DNA polymerase-3 subunit epsilon [Psychromonas sp.]|jgi:DNA polymerase-3 subunit epsilon|uniref:3'-5' exonuclease n=1 Tax=Psychromonas sp. TaxID=1884585 RepID=UPI0039E38471
MSNADTLVILDFETTGLSPDMGDRAIEIGAVLIENGKVTDRFQELMNPGQRISGFIEDFTGISNAMLKDAPPCAEVMQRFAHFIGDYNLVAHNASFDKRFLDAELKRISRNYAGQFACSMLLARRIFQHAPNHKLGTLVEYVNIPTDGVFHRALYDSEMTAKVWLAMLEQIQENHNIQTIPFELVQKLTKTPAKSVQRLLSSWS